MKKIIASLCLIAFTAIGYGQIKTPDKSPLQKISQKVGLTDITLEYSRPSVRGRKIFGGLEDFGKVWRTGANSNTTISLSTDFMIDNQTIKAGTYAVYTIPGEKNWEIILYTDTNNWGTPKKWDDSKVAVKTTVPAENMPMTIETFTITFDNLTNNSFILGLLWENTMVNLPITLPTDNIVSKQIEAKMAGPSAQDMYAAAVYYLEADKDIKKAQNWIDTAVKMTADSPKFWFLRQQALIHAKAGNVKGAIAAAKESLKYAEKANNAGYIKMNKASLKEWGAL